MRILTFDIEEWFHLLDVDKHNKIDVWDNHEYRIEKNVDLILNMLSDTNTRATFFCLGWIASKHPSVIRKISELGYEIGSHSNFHQLAYKQSRTEYEIDLRESIDILRQVTGGEIKYYRAPGFSITDSNTWTFEVLSENGIEVDCSIFPTYRSHGGFHGFPCRIPCTIVVGNTELKEFPMSFYNLGSIPVVYSGGGYFRLAPYSLLEYLFKRPDYQMTYFHPRDFDHGQPRLDGLSFTKRFKSYIGLQYSEEKLRKLTSTFKFVDIAHALKTIEWEHQPRVDVSLLKKNLTI